MIRVAAQEPTVQRIFVNAAIKKALCREAKGDRGWLSKVRPMWGQTTTSISASNARLERRVRVAAAAGGERGCSAGDLAFWFSDW